MVGGWTLDPDLARLPACDCDESAIGITRADGAGQVTDQWARSWLSDHGRFTIRPVLDIEGQAPVD